MMVITEFPRSGIMFLPFPYAAYNFLLIKSSTQYFVIRVNVVVTLPMIGDIININTKTTWQRMENNDFRSTIMADGERPFCYLFEMIDDD